MNGRDIFSDVTHCDLTPNAMQSRQALVTFDRFVAFITLGWAVAFNPVMMHHLEQNKSTAVRRSIQKQHTPNASRAITHISVLLGLHVSLDTRRRRSSHAALMDCVLAN